MMFNFSGIIYRLWGTCGFILIIGILAFLVADMRSKDVNKQCVLAGTICVVVSLWLGIFYSSCLLKPEIASFSGSFCEERRNSRVAPPLPFTMEYSFYDSNNNRCTLYLDVLSKKDIIPDGFHLDANYTIYYEAKTKIIIGVVLAGE